MNSVSVTRSIGAPPDDVRDAIGDVEAFMRAAGFDQVTVEDRTVRVANRVGIATIELTLELVDAPDAVLAYEQREGIFDEMRTAYRLDAGGDGTDVKATTAFELDVAVVGAVLDSTIIERQRRTELAAQLDWLEDRVSR
ncbi:SRPBCC family protein [Halorubrum sp. CBA1125]|uniref:SRPBCC family protein n=1 Tax=Halorubrum sp. CBA1125 TaxID=2668072 RepID=UPI00135E864F|nr:SRPBCC family protein [Halorubrum sp. CBA1125]MUW14714.1 SRPBCC family protein [Halorubrum sp. CBA1125]